MKEDDKVLVRISAVRKVRYTKTVEIPASAVGEYFRAVDRVANSAWFSNFAERYIDPTKDEGIIDKHEMVDVDMDVLKKP